MPRTPSPHLQARKVPIWAQNSLAQDSVLGGITHHSSPTVMREEKKTPLPATDPDAKDEDKASDISFGSAGLPWLMIKPLVLQLPSRWQSFANKAKEDLNKDDRELLYNTTTAIQHLIHARMIMDLSKYKPDWSKSLEITENLSGVSDTYMQFVSFALQRDLKKYLSDDISNVYTENLGWLLIYGALVQGGLVGLNAGLEKDLDFTSLITPATESWTAAPAGFGRPLQLKNIPDPRWSSYGFGSSPTGLEAKWSGFGDPAKPYSLNLKLGLNIASLADLYPEDEEEKKKYAGFELYPYFSLRHDWAKDDVQPTLKNRWLVGAFIGGEGIYTLVEGGQQTRPDDTVAETYLRSAMTLRGLGQLSLLQLSQEYSFRPENSDVRARLNAAAQIKLVDRKAWETTVGAGIGGLLPGAGLPGTWDASGSLSLHHKYYRSQEEGAEPFKTGVSLGTMWRPEDPFNADSSRLFSLSGKLSILDMVILSMEHHRIQPGLGPPGAQPNAELPTNDTRFMLMFGPGIWRWY